MCFFAFSFRETCRRLATFLEGLPFFAHFLWEVSCGPPVPRERQRLKISLLPGPPYFPPPRGDRASNPPFPVVCGRWGFQPPANTVPVFTASSFHVVRYLGRRSRSPRTTCLATLSNQTSPILQKCQTGPQVVPALTQVQIRTFFFPSPEVVAGATFLVEAGP